MSGVVAWVALALGASALVVSLVALWRTRKLRMVIDIDRSVLVRLHSKQDVAAAVATEIAGGMQRFEKSAGRLA